MRTILPLVLTLTAILLAQASAGIATDPQGNLFVRTNDGDDTNNGTSWDTSFKTLQKALATATSGQIIFVAEGTYYPDEGPGQTDNDRSSAFSLKSGVTIYGGFQNTGNPTFTERNYEDNATILSGDIDQNDGPDFTNNSNNAYHVLSADGTDSLALLDGFIISGGNADGEAFLESFGSGLLCQNSSSPSLVNCSFKNNSSTADGGAITNSFSSPSFINCSFLGNRSKNQSGGAIFNFNSSPSFADCIFQNNSADSDGGAIYSRSSSSPSLINCSFMGNSASSRGGAIFSEGASSSLTNCSFMNNSADSDGGAISNSTDSSTLTNCSFRGNSSGGGGAISNRAFSSTLITNCSFLNNSTVGSFDDGGAIYNSQSSPSIANCSFQGNSSDANGGAISNSSFNSNSNSSPSITNCSFKNNSASKGGAISNRSIFTSVLLTNCSFLGNSANSNGGAIYNDRASPSLFNCSFLGNFSNSEGGAIFNTGFTSTISLINCSFHGNSASNNGGSVFNTSNSSSNLTNCILWNNSAGASTSTSSASISIIDGSEASYSHCLIQNIKPPGIGNLDGTNPLNNPRFVFEVDPLTAPHPSGGDLRLLLGSPAINSGLDSVNSTTSDLAGNPRKIDTIDLGSYEGAVDNINLLFSTDFDLDGVAYSLEQALGTNPDLADTEDLKNFKVRPNGSITFGYDPNHSSNILLSLMRSTDLNDFSHEVITSDDPSFPAIGTTQQQLMLTDPAPPVGGQAFYRLEATLK